MNFEEIKNFDVSDLNQLGSAPMPVKVVLMIVVTLLILGGGYYLDISKQVETLKARENTELELREQFARKYHKAANLEAYKAQLAEMEQEFGSMLKQLPGKTEIPAVILDVSQTGLSSGLKILLFKPQPEIQKGFYAEKPIQIRLQGTYHQMAKFASGIAALPRIVTLHDITIKPENNSELLVMDVTAKTYRYLADDEMERSDNNQKGRRGNGRK